MQALACYLDNTVTTRRGNMIEILTGIIAGVVGGLGMGGGTILILFLSMFLGVEQHVAQATNVIFFVPTAISAIIISLKNKNINLKLGMPICIWGIIGALIGGTISSKMNVNMLRKSFAIFLILIAIYQIYYLYKEYIKDKKRHNNIKLEKGGRV